MKQLASKPGIDSVHYARVPRSAVPDFLYTTSPLKALNSFPIGLFSSVCAVNDACSPCLRVSNLGFQSCVMFGFQHVFQYDKSRDYWLVARCL